jgi:hypothetical protein
MIRRLHFVVTMLSLLTCVSAFAFWTRSDERRDEVRFHWRGIAYALASDRGRVGIDNEPQLREFAQAAERAMSEVKDATMAYKGGGDGSDPYLANAMQANNRLYTLIAHGPPASSRHAIPYWVIVLGSLVLPAVWAWRWHQRKLRIAARRCASCGYDLRASAERCPECGTPITSNVTKATA